MTSDVDELRERLMHLLREDAAADVRRAVEAFLADPRPINWIEAEQHAVAYRQRREMEHTHGS